jgi:hypothetical protein
MAFTVEDVRDLIRLLAEHPEWRAELRPLILTDELLRLPQTVDRLAARMEELAAAQARTEARVGELAAAQARTEARVGELAAAQARTEARLEELAQAHARTEARLEELARAQARTEARLEELAQAQARTEVRLQELAEAQSATEGRLVQVLLSLEHLSRTVEALAAGQQRISDRLGHVDGRWLEQRFYDRAPAYFGPRLRKPRVVEATDLGVDDALQAGRITREEYDEITRLDVMVRGEDRDSPASEPLILAVEVSTQIKDSDIQRARRRARLLERLGHRAVAAVGGERIAPAQRKAAEQSGVLVHLVPRE